MSTILVTGATGTVGQAVVPALKRRGHRLVYAVRDVGRAHGALGRYATEGDLFLPGDVTLPLLGLNPSFALEECGHIDHILHLAGSIKFDAKVAADTSRTNVNGLCNVLGLADALGKPMVHHMSTAYVSGNADVFTEDDMDIGQESSNPYERSKLEAEKLFATWSGKKRIYRMSIMTGRSDTGEISGFSGFYGFFDSFDRLRESLWRKWLKKSDDLRREGIWFTPKGVLQLPLTLCCSSTARLNLIPADWLAETLVDLMGSDSPHLVHHLVHPNPPRVRDVIEESLAHMKIGGLEYSSGEASSNDAPLLGILQRGLDKGLEAFRPYVMHGSKFTDDHTRRVLGGRYVEPSTIDQVFLGKMLDYAQANQFGREVLATA